MKYLKKIFEDANLIDIDTIKDICLELEDIGMIVKHIRKIIQ